jgi:hypothetical protein
MVRRQSMCTTTFGKESSPSKKLLCRGMALRSLPGRMGEKRVWSTLLGMSTTNAYNMHTRFGNKHKHHEHFMLFVAAASICITNKYKVVTVADLPGADSDNDLPAKHYTRKFLSSNQAPALSHSFMPLDGLPLVCNGK